jgi:transcriptional regulator with XRE-family HTH domain
MIKLGERIKELRLRDGQTQEALASELGVTPQAISRWENGICYPDLELVPSIAHFFGTSIDELFGYDNERDKKVDALAARIDEMNRQNNGEDVSMDACIALAREALIEFPGNEKLTLALASALYNAGYVRYGEYHVTDPDGYSRYDTARHRTYAEWQEAVRLYEKLLTTLTDGGMRQRAMIELAQLYTNLGEQEKAMRLAESAPDFAASKIFLRIKAFDGKDAVAAYGDALIETVRTSAELVESIVLTDENLPPHTSAEMIANAISMIGLVCTDGFFGRLSGFAACLSMLLSYYRWLAEEADAAFEALDQALAWAEAADGLCDGFYTAPLLRHVKIEAPASEHRFAEELPEVWPWWSVPQYRKVKSGMQADPRWDAWVAKTKRTAE